MLEAKKLLLTEKWEDKEFTPADLAKTRQVIKLATQQLEGMFEKHRPVIIVIPGVITHIFRDRAWGLLPLLQYANPLVKEALDKKKEANTKGQSFNLKKNIREITHLHHAVDATAVGLISHWLVGPGHQSLNGELARYIHKGKLTDEERAHFEKIRHQLRLPKFYDWASKNILKIHGLDQALKNQISSRLAERRVIQHLPASMNGLNCDETIYRIFDPFDKSRNGRRIKRWFEKLLTAEELPNFKSLPDPNDQNEDRILITARKRKGQSGAESGKTLHDTNNTWRWIYVVTSRDAIHGFQPERGSNGSLAAVKGVKLLGENFGVAVIKANDGKQYYHLIRPRKVYPQFRNLRTKYPDSQIVLIRKGSQVELIVEGQITRLRIFGCGERPRRGIYFDAGMPDATIRQREIQISAFANGTAKLIKQPLLTG